MMEPFLQAIIYMTTRFRLDGASPETHLGRRSIRQEIVSTARTSPAHLNLHQGLRY